MKEAMVGQKLANCRIKIASIFNKLLIPVTKWRRIYEVGCWKNGVPCVVYHVVAASFSKSGNEVSSKTQNVMWIRKLTRCVYDRQFIFRKYSSKVIKLLFRTHSIHLNLIISFSSIFVDIFDKV